MAEGREYILAPLPGIKRDGTQFAARNWIGGQWMRFQRGLPRKIGGYRAIITGLVNIPRGTAMVNNSPNFNFYIGDRSSLRYWTINENGNVLLGPVDRTPVVFGVNPNNDWQFETMFSTVNNSNILIAHSAPNLASIDSTVNSPVYYGDSLAVTPLIPTGISTSGGVVVLHPYLFYFGNDGDVSWTAANDPTTTINSVRVTATKLVAGLATRGGNSSPAGLLWSLDSVIRVTFIGPSPTDFRFDTVTSESSILSSRGIIEYDGTFYWAGVDRFLYYQGVVNEVPNNMNLNYFFDNLNYDQRQKVWATKITQYGEIWWHYPSGDATECNAAIIYNVRENTWYDSSIARSDGVFDQTFAQPIWASNDTPGDFKVWIHEEGLDQVIDAVTTAIPYSIISPSIAYCAIGPDGQNAGQDNWTELYRIEPDAIQSGNMNLQVFGRKYARSAVVPSPVYTFTDTQEKIDIREQRREMYLVFSGSDVGGDFQMGQMLMVMRLGDARQ